MKKLVKLFAVLAIVFSGITGLLGLGEQSEAAGLDEVKVTIHKKKVVDNYPSHQNTGEIDDHWAEIPGLGGVTFEAFEVTDQYYDYLESFELSNPDMSFKELQKLVVEQIQADAKNRRNGDFAYATSNGEGVTSDVDGTVEFDNLPDKAGSENKDAVYVFVETASIHPTVKAEEPMVVALPIFKVNDDGDKERNRDLHIYPKNETSEGIGEKEVVDTSGTVITAEDYGTVDIGDTIDYKITIPLTDLMQTLQIRDTPTKGLEYVDNTAAIDGLGSFTLNLDSQGGFTVVLSETDLNDLRDAGKDSIELTYQMIVTEEALPDELLTNDAEVSLDNGNTWVPTDKPEDPEKPSEYFTGGKKFIKKDPNLSKPLVGAEFVVVKGDNSSGTVVPTHYLTRDDDGKVVWVAISDQDPDTWTDAVKLTSNAQGNFEVTGLMYSEGLELDETYALVETKAPAGYVVLDEPFAFDIVKDGYNDPSNISDVENIPSGYLPETGGKGIYLFLLIGAALMGGAVIWYKRSRKHSAQV